jgi:hypothetical protein
MWMALLADPSLCGNLLEEKVSMMFVHKGFTFMVKHAGLAINCWPLTEDIASTVFTSLQALEEERKSMGGSQRSLHSYNLSGEVSPRGGAPTAAAAAGAGRGHQPGSIGGSISRRTSTSADDDAASAAATSVAFSTEGGGPDAPAPSLKPRGFGRPARAPSEAGSVDAASLATERGSEAILGDIDEEAAPPGPGGSARDAAGDGAELYGDGTRDSQEAATVCEAHLSSSAADPEPADGSFREASCGSRSGIAKASESVSNHPTQPGLAEIHAQEPLRHGASAAATAKGIASAGAEYQPHGEQAAGEEATKHGKAEAQEPPSPSHGDMGHLPVARSTPERELSLHSDPGHMTAESSPSQLVSLVHLTVLSLMLRKVVLNSSVTAITGVKLWQPVSLQMSAF